MTVAKLLLRRALALVGVVLVSSVIFGGLLWFTPAAAASMRRLTASWAG